MENKSQIDNIINNKETTEQKQENVKIHGNKLLNNLDQLESTTGSFDIKVFGVGGAGCNVIKHMVQNRSWAENVGLYALNTDVKSLQKMSSSKIQNLYCLGSKLLKGAGSGENPIIGKKAVEEDSENIKEALKGTDLLFLIAGLGKGTGSGSTPEIAKIAKELNIITVGIVNLPSITAEGNKIYQNALASLKELKKHCNSVTIISNDLIISNSKNSTISFIEAFNKSNQQITSIIGEIIDIVNCSTEMNIDFADVKNFFLNCHEFNATSLEFKGEYTKGYLKNAIDAAFKSSYSQVKLQNAIKVLANATINSQTPVTIAADIREIFKDISNNKDISVITGIEYSEQKNIHLSFLIASDKEVDYSSLYYEKQTDNENKYDDVFDINFENSKETQNDLENKKSDNKEKTKEYEELLTDFLKGNNNFN